MKKHLTPYYRSPRTTSELRANDDPETGHLARKRRNRQNLPNSWTDLHSSRLANRNWKERRGKKYHEQKRIEHCLEIRVKHAPNSLRLWCIPFELKDRYPEVEVRYKNINNPSPKITTARLVWRDVPESGIVDEILKSLHLMGSWHEDAVILKIKYNNKFLKIE